MKTQFTLALIALPMAALADAGEIELNAGAPTLTLEVANSGDRPVQVASITISPKPTRA